MGTGSEAIYIKLGDKVCTKISIRSHNGQCTFVGLIRPLGIAVPVEIYDELVHVWKVSVGGI